MITIQSRYGILLGLSLGSFASAQGAPIEPGLICHKASAAKTLGLADAKVRRQCFSGDFSVEVKGFHWDNPRYRISFKNGRPLVQDLVTGVPAKAQILAGPEYPMPILSLTTLEDSGEEAISIVTRLMIQAEKVEDTDQVSFTLNVLDVVTSFHSYNEATSRIEHFSGADVTLLRIKTEL